MKTTGRISSKQGFTLLEILLVVVLLGLLAGAVIPNFSKMFRVSVQSSVRRYAALVRYAYDQSILTGRIHRIVLNMDNQSWHVEATEPGMLPIDKAKMGLMPDSVHESERVTSEPTFKAVGKNLIDKMPKGVIILEVDSWRSNDKGHALTKGEASIYAYPNGFIDESTVVLAESGREKPQRYKITTQSLTGRIKIEVENPQ